MVARIKVKPAKQGELDGACGFYAVTNAISILEPDLLPHEVFRMTWESFLVDGDPMRIIEGTTRGNLKNILSRTVEKINLGYDLTYENGNSYKLSFAVPYWRHAKDRERGEVIDVLREANYKKGCVAIIGYGFSKDDFAPPYAHWTVVKEVTEECMVTHDSSGEKKEIHFSEIRVDSFHQKSHVSRPFNVFSSDIFLVRKV